MTSADLPSREEYLRTWSALHGGIDPAASPVVRVWLQAVYVVARPLAALGFSPSAVTMAGLLVTAAAVPLAAVGDRWLLLAGGVVLLGGIIDSLDGAVAVLTHRATRWGALLDSVVDRVAEAVALLALWLAGAPPAVCVLAGALTWLQEYARARAAVSGIDLAGAITPGERPTRVLVAGMFLLAAGVYPAAAGTWLFLAAWAWALTAGLSLTILLTTAYRASPPSTR